MNYCLEQMEELEADGIDFIPLFDKFPYTIIASYTKEEFKNGNVAVPKNSYKFWKIYNGKKVYIVY